MNEPAPFGGQVYIADKSVWSRADRLPESVKRDWQQALVQGLIATSPIVMLEILYSAQSPADYDRWRERLEAIPVNLAPDRRICESALRAYAELAARSQHRGVSLPDVLIAATAHSAEVGVLHYDSDFDRLSAVPALRFESRWIVPRGSIS